jgi:hypothetical protein
MSEYTSDTFENAEFDLSDPALASYTMNIDMEDLAKPARPAPVSDGIHLVRFRLGNRKEGPPIYVKGSKSEGRVVEGSLKVVAVLEGRVLDRETGEERSFLQTWYPTTQVFKGATGSHLTAFYYLATGKPIKSSNPNQAPSPADVLSAIETLFAEAGEEGVVLWAKTRWLQRIPKVDENGMPVYKPGSEYPDTDDIRGEAKIKKLAALRGIPESRAHLFIDPVSGDERSAYAEVVNLEDSSKFEEV